MKNGTFAPHLLLRSKCSISIFFSKLLKCKKYELFTGRPPDKSVYWKIIFFISHPKHMFWIPKRTVLMRQFFLAPKTHERKQLKFYNGSLYCKYVLSFNFIYAESNMSAKSIDPVKIAQ